jgi:opacity protein-like surface antigen
MDESFSTTVFNNFGTTGPATDTDTFNPGPVVNLGAGYRLPYGFRIEGELGYAYYTADTISPLSTNGAFPALTGARLPLQSGGERDQYSFTTNAFYDLPVAGQFVPYVGAGVGVYHGTGPGARAVYVAKWRYIHKSSGSQHERANPRRGRDHRNP